MTADQVPVGARSAVFVFWLSLQSER